MGGIYINKMKMPVNCMRCPIACSSGCSLRDGLMCSQDMLDGRREDCPLIPVPDHGRLIDGDKVFKRLQKQAMSVWGDGNPRYQIVLEVMDAIRFAPTIIPASGGDAE